MPCTEAYKEHIMYTFHGFCNIVIRNAAITAWRDQHRRHKREISLEYLTDETKEQKTSIMEKSKLLDFSTMPAITKSPPFRIICILIKNAKNR